MPTRQPLWKMLDNLGDKNPIDYGGFFVYEDRRGLYPPEVELLESPDSDDAPEGWTLSRAIIERDPLTEWWWEKLPEVAATVDMPVAELQRMAQSENIITRAMVYQYLMSYFGAYEFDSYPRQYKRRSALPRRIRRMREAL